MTLGAVVTASDSGDSWDERRDGLRLLAFSGGYSHPLDARKALSTELFVTDFRQGCRLEGGPCDGFTLIRASAGLAYSSGGSPGRGFLLQPRLILGYVRHHSSRDDPDVHFPPRESPGTNGFSLQAGLDLGYQWQLGPVHLALVGGLAAGVSIRSGSIVPFMIADAENAREFKPTPVLGFNLHLLRLGWAF
jgi:hypothetical protein